MNKKAFISMALAFSVLSLSSCATKSEHKTDQHDNSEKLETFNRAVFKFNYRMDKYVLKPIAEGYRAITTQDIRNRVNSALSNVVEPISAANQAIQGEFKQSGVSLSRFAVNSTLGLAGTFDVATGWGLQKKSEGFDDTLAKWCVPDGPFIVLPFFGPSTPRAASAMIVDSASSPVYWATNNMSDGSQNTILYSYAGVRTIAVRENALDLLNDLERNSVDFYATMKSAYLQNRAGKNCLKDKSNAKANTYDFDFGIEDEDEAFDSMDAKKANK